MMAQKNLFVTYILWFWFGWLGLHHFYLGRDRHAFTFWSIYNGFVLWPTRHVFALWSQYGGIIFLFGWTRDLWRIPSYVEDANESEKYLAELTSLIRTHQFPRFTVVRFAGMLFVGYFYGTLARLALPVEELPILVDVVVCCATTCGVHLVGNIGRKKGTFFTPFLVTLFCNILLRYYLPIYVNGILCTGVASFTFSYFREYKHTRKKRTVCKRIVILSTCMFIICTLWISFFYFNADITTEDGKKVKRRDYVNHYFKSLCDYGRQHGWANLYNEFFKGLDPKGIANAQKVLGINENTSEEEIKKVYKKLVRQWHPDRHKTNKEVAQEIFMEIQNSYDILMSRKSSEPRSDEERTEF